MRNVMIISLFILCAIASPAQETPIRQLYRTILANSSGERLPTTEELFSKLNEDAVRALPEAEINATLLLALRCVQSPSAEVRQDGLYFLIAVVLRYDSAKLLEPYIDDLSKILDGFKDDASPRRTIFYVLGSLKPKLPPKAIAYLTANLESSRNSNEEALTIAASLLEAAPADASILHRVLLVVSSRSDAGLTNGVIRQLGLSKNRLPEAIDFISANLNKNDPYLRASAVDAVSRLDKDKRAEFSSQLNRIASDPAEDQYVRGQAASALKP